MDNSVYIEWHSNVEYPAPGNYNPHICYPEYLFGQEEVSSTKNDVYHMIRSILKRMGFDNQNFGTPQWNPLGDFIQPGQIVVIKPNWVDDHNTNKKVTENPFDCLVTHPACIRAICDYCLIALKGTGQIIIGDAPIQDCIIEKLWEKAHFDNINFFYSAKKENVAFADFRKSQRVVNGFAVKINEIQINAPEVTICMNDKTAFKDLQGEWEYNTPNYSKDVTAQYHFDDKHYYVISKAILDANVIINLCKPKCHRYAGITASLKNAVGMASRKESLPHRRIGSSTKGGDSYQGTNIFKQLIDKVLLAQAAFENKKNILAANICRFFYGGLFCLSRLFDKDKSLKGCWHGNDTIWRTILDINYIIRYADVNGSLRKNPQRTIFNMGDMIVAGEHNGPLSPEPKKLGAIIASADAAAMDMTVAKLMGFDCSKIPLLKNIMEQKSWVNYQTPEVSSNNKNLCGKLDQLQFPLEFHFKPHDAWDGKIELERI